MKKTILIFSALIVALILLFQLSKYYILSGELKIEIAIAVIAIIFFFVGIYLHKTSLHNPILPVSEMEIDNNKIKELDISNREYEVLKKIAIGLSNKEIAEALFVSESTIKTHVSNLLQKLHAKRRTQAVQIAQELHIL